MRKYVTIMMLLVGAAALNIVTSCGRIDITNQPDTEPSRRPVDPSPPSNPSYPGGGDVVERQQFMIFHNLKRCWHNVSDVVWDDAMAADARAHAVRCTLRPRVSPNGVGESVTYGPNLDLIKALDNWYMSGIFFPYGAADAPDNMREYAQMLWSSTRSIGCAAAKCGSQNYYVCRYGPSGNVKGEAAKNVFRLKSDFAKCTGLPRS